MSEKLIYLDYNATTPCDPRVVEAMLPWFTDNPGNAASRSHPAGWKAEEAVKIAREAVADLIDAAPEEIVFTSGATEAVNLALKGVFEAYISKGRHIVTLATEHKAVLDTCRHLEKMGAEVTYLPVQPDGLLDLEILKSAIRPDTILVAVMWANNETGVIQDMEAIGKICAEKETLLFS
ncbi:MAG TPA: aminotransferase class V-fold PLP-dependent enzyme, partial [Saprospiraceae bacterium]|nr:aminotransferase class V-fold PLP-dependent enzyme [Saprospiraceae bacterium]